MILDTIKNYLNKFDDQAKRVRIWKKDGGEKLRYEYNLNSDSIVFDVGTFTGQWANTIAEKFDCVIYAFEPIKEYADKIAHLFSNNQKINVYNFGLGKSSSEKLMTVNGDRSSLFQSSTNQEKIKLVSISNFISDNNIPQIDLMKINIEGGEYDLLEDLIASGLANKVKNIQVQFHDFIPNADIRMKAIQTELAKTHHLTYQYEFVWENWEINSL